MNENPPIAEAGAGAIAAAAFVSSTFGAKSKYTKEKEETGAAGDCDVDVVVTPAFEESKGTDSGWGLPQRL